LGRRRTESRENDRVDYLNLLIDPLASSIDILSSLSFFFADQLDD